MAKKYVIVGGVAGGASAAARLRRLDETADIVLFEKGPCISYSNCALPYALSDTVPELSSLILMTPERFRAQHRIDVRTDSEVTAILREEKKVRVRETGGRVYEESYDFLVLSPGPRRKTPPPSGSTPRPAARAPRRSSAADSSASKRR